MRTTLQIPDHVFKRAKLKAVHEGIPLKQFVNRALERELNDPSGAPARKPGKWKIPVAPHGLNDKKLNWDQIKQIMDEESDARLLHKLTDNEYDAQH